MEKTKIMEEREEATGNEFKELDGGYGVLEGCFSSKVIYISIPTSHPDVNKSYDDLDIEVNGGLTFSKENVFGWDYGHFENSDDYEGDIKRTLEFFKSRQ